MKLYSPNIMLAPGVQLTGIIQHLDLYASISISRTRHEMVLVQTTPGADFWTEIPKTENDNSCCYAKGPLKYHIDRLLSETNEKQIEKILSENRE